MNTLINLIASVLGLIMTPIASVCQSIAPTFFAHMGNDFPSWLFVMGVVTGIIYVLDRFIFEPKRLAKLSTQNIDVRPPAKNMWLDFGRQFFPVIAAVFVLRAFVVEPFRIPSGSMIPTLHVGDFILVNRFAYGLRCPIGDCTIIPTSMPKHGDVVVFRYPVDPKMDFIKRVIGLPGDHIVYSNKVLTVNGKVEPRTLVGVFEGESNSPTDRNDLFSENYEGVIHDSLQSPDHPAKDFEFTVPEGQYFMMGDNRDGSSDSRFWGTVPAENLKGKAFLIWMSYDAQADNLSSRIVSSRIGTRIH